MFANTQMMGMDMGFPDVCLTPAPPSPVPVPIPYPNIAMQMTAIPSQFKVLMSGTPAHNMGTVVPMSNGDNPGLALGVASGLVMGPKRNLTGAFTCLVGAMPVTRLTSVSLHNSTNAPGCTLVPSQVKVLVLSP